MTWPGNLIKPQGDAESVVNSRFIDESTMTEIKVSIIIFGKHITKINICEKFNLFNSVKLANCKHTYFIRFNLTWNLLNNIIYLTTSTLHEQWHYVSDFRLECKEYNMTMYFYYVYFDFWIYN